MTAPSPARAAPRGFADVETWVFDLDNTLYPHHLNLWQQVDDRIRSFISNFLKVTPDEAFKVQKAVLSKEQTMKLARVGVIAAAILK